jgi:hypothetical protein
VIETPFLWLLLCPLLLVLLLSLLLMLSPLLLPLLPPLLVFLLLMLLPVCTTTPWPLQVNITVLIHMVSISLLCNTVRE